MLLSSFWMLDGIWLSTKCNPTLSAVKSKRRLITNSNRDRGVSHAGFLRANGDRYLGNSGGRTDTFSAAGNGDDNNNTDRNPFLVAPNPFNFIPLKFPRFLPRGFALRRRDFLFFPRDCDRELALTSSAIACHE